MSLRRGNQTLDSRLARTNQCAPASSPQAHDSI